MHLCFYPAGFGAGTPQQEAVPKGQKNFQELKKFVATGRFLPSPFCCVSEFSHFNLLADC